jgi:hypothetical protein
VIDPRFLTVREWTDAMTVDLDTYGPLPRLDDDEKWRDWAVAVITLPGISVFSPPSPVEFDDWRTWADRFNQAVPL